MILLQNIRLQIYLSQLFIYILSLQHSFLLKYKK